MSLNLKVSKSIIVGILVSLSFLSGLFVYMLVAKNEIFEKKTSSTTVRYKIPKRVVTKKVTLKILSQQPKTVSALTNISPISTSASKDTMQHDVSCIKTSHIDSRNNDDKIKTNSNLVDTVELQILANKSIATPTNTLPTLITSQNSDEVTAVPAENTTNVTFAENKTFLADKPLSYYYTLQLMTCAEITNAFTELKKINTLKNASINTSLNQPGHKRYYRIMLGHFLSYQKALQALSQLNHEQYADAFIRKMEIIKVAPTIPEQI